MAKRKEPEPKWSDWITREKKRAILSFVGGGLVVLVGGAWSAFQYFEKTNLDKTEVKFEKTKSDKSNVKFEKANSDKSDVKIEASYKLCIGQMREICPAGSVFLEAGGDMEDIAANWAKQECSRYARHDIKVQQLDCACAIVDVKCTTQ